MSSTYSKTFEIRWADLDPNQHLRHTSYLDYATHLRFSYLSEHGFPPRRFMELQVSPVILREEIRYIAEVRIGQRLTIDMRVTTMSDDGRHFSMVHNATRDDGRPCAEMTVDGGCLDLVKRKLTDPPQEFQQLLRRLMPT